MKSYYFAALLLIVAGCAARKTPAIVAAGTAAATSPPRVVVTPLPTPATPPLDPKFVRAQAIIVRELERLKSASPERDLETAWANKNTKFVAVRGVGWRLPGVPKNRESALLDRYDAIPVEGTTDYIFSSEVAQLNAIATRYAARYNQLLLAKLDAQPNAIK